MTWLLYSTFAAAVWALVCHADKYLLEKYCKNTSPGVLILFSSLIGLPVVIFLSVLVPHIFSINLFNVSILILTGVLYIAGVTFYLYALDEDETSTVAPQMLITPVLSAVLSGILLKEILNGWQIIAVFVIIIGSIGLSINFKDFHLNMKVFGYMFIMSIMIAFNTVLFKMMTVEADFWIAILWQHVGFSIAGIAIFIGYAPYRRDFIKMIMSNSSGVLGVNIFGEILTILGNLSFNYATLLGPIALVQTFTEGIQPVFVIIFGVILTLLLPRYVKEEMILTNYIKKGFFVSIMIIGIYLSRL